MTAASHANSASTREPILLWTNRILEALWLLTVFLVPLIFVEPGSLLSEFDGFVALPKVAALRVLAGLMAALWLLQWGLTPRGGAATGSNPAPAVRRVTGLNWRGILPWLNARPTRWVLLAVCLYLGAILLSTVLSDSFSVSLWGRAPGNNDYATYTMLCFFLLFGVLATHLRTQSQVWRLLGVIAAAGGLVAGYAVLQHFSLDFYQLNWLNTTRSPATLGNPVFAASVLLLTVVVSLTLAAAHLRTLQTRAAIGWGLGLWMPLLLVHFLGLVFTLSRGSWGGTALALVVFFGLAALLVDRLTLLKVGLVTGIAVALAALILVPSPVSRWLAPPVDATTTSELIAERLGTIEGTESVSGLRGRAELWKTSWSLMTERPWFQFDDAKPRPIQLLTGYGPETFRYAFRLQRDIPPPENTAQVTHAHNYFIHQGVELGFLGILTALAVFGCALLVAGYLLLRRRETMSVPHRIVLAGLLALLVGRLVEQGVGVARVGDLTIFWALLAALVALPAVFGSVAGTVNDGSVPATPGTNRRRRNRRTNRAGPVATADSWQYGRLALVAVLVLGLGVLSWTRGLSYPRGAVVAAQANAHRHAGNLEIAGSLADRAIQLAPDVVSYYRLRAEVIDAYRDAAQTQREPRCDSAATPEAYEICLLQQSLAVLERGVQYRNLDLFGRVTLAETSLELAQASNEQVHWTQAARRFREVSQLWPRHWELRNQAFQVMLEAGQPEEALEFLNDSLRTTGVRGDWAATLRLAGEAQLQLGLFPEALETFDEALALEPEQADLYNARAKAYANLGEYQAAIADYDRAVSLDPELAEAYVNRGAAYADLQQFQRAAQDASSAIEQSPDYAEAYSLRAMALAVLDRNQESLADVERAVQLGAERTTLEARIQQLNGTP